MITRERLRYTCCLHYAEGSAMTLLLLKLVFTRLPTARVPLLAQPAARPAAACAKSGPTGS